MNLYDPGTLKSFLGRHGLRADKGLGQHFLCSQPVVMSIVHAVADCEGVLEIGPGPGVLTSPISERVPKMVALELDGRMVGLLAESAPRAEIRPVDALRVDLSAILNELPEPRAVVSNLPYYITGPLLTKIAEARSHFSVAVLMMQKEVANRIVAPAGNSDRGSLSVYLQAQFDIRQVADAPAAVFLPPPKVDSRVLAFFPKSTGLEGIDEQTFFRLVRLGFAQPRKTLVNNLVAGYRVKRDQAVEWVDALELKETARPQELVQDRWVALSRLVPR